jgi:hypothetical protein
MYQNMRIGLETTQFHLLKKEQSKITNPSRTS